MNFDELDIKMRVFETAHDHCVLPGLHMVMRIDGRGFTRLTKEVYPFEAPFDDRVRDYMVATVEHLMTCGFHMLFGYTQSDEISLLLHPREQMFNRKLRKYMSILASEAGACFSLKLGGIASFDCRVSQLPRVEDVVDYFRWRQQDAHRNALSAHCYWLLRRQGQSVKAATDALVGLSIAAKNELLFQSGINFNTLPAWQRRGVGLYWDKVIHEGFNPLTQKSVATTRQRLKQDFELPIRDEYSAFIRSLLAKATVTSAE
jgi:tRNA(His) guanylyltransferase